MMGLGFWEPFRRQGKDFMARRTFFRWFAICGSAMALIGLLPSCEVTIWDGSWWQEEYRITFLDHAGRPVEGVQLRVENAAGSNFYHFPVTDYLPNHLPASDADGVLVFHHAPRHGVSGHSWWLFFLIPMGEHSGPIYVCRFLLDGKEVHRIRYNDLVNTGTTTVRRRWKWLTMAELQELVLQGVAWDDTEPTRLRIFDLNKNGRLEREELYAVSAFYRAQERAMAIEAGEKPEWEQVEFRLVERTVVLDRP